MFFFKRKLFLVGAICLALIIGGGWHFISNRSFSTNVSASQSVAVQDTPVFSQGANSLDAQIEEMLQQMSLTEKIGQMVMIGVHGTDVNEDILYMLRQFHIGGIIFFDRNMESVEQVGRFTNHLQAQSDGKTPLLIAIDEEGGDVVRMEHALEAPPSQAEIGESNDVIEAEHWARKTAKSLKSLGINVNLAPVADIGSPDSRSYGTDAITVTDFVRSAAQGYVAENMIFCLKHFPGIGKGKVDSHFDASAIDVSLEKMESEDLLPFRTVIQEFSPDQFLILVSHFQYPNIDANLPASLSSRIMRELLREQLGYEGVIITDDMEMGAVANYYSFREMGIRSIQAGADIVLICHEYAHEEDVYMGILEAVQANQISEEQINESVKRILKVKLSLKS